MPAIELSRDYEMTAFWKYASTGKLTVYEAEEEVRNIKGLRTAKRENSANGF